MVIKTYYKGYSDYDCIIYIILYVQYLLFKLNTKLICKGLSTEDVR